MYFISITFFWLVLIRHTYYLVWAIVFFKLKVNKVFNSIQFFIPTLFVLPWRPLARYNVKISNWEND